MEPEYFCVEPNSRGRDFEIDFNSSQTNASLTNSVFSTSMQGREEQRRRVNDVTHSLFTSTVFHTLNQMRREIRGFLRSLDAQKIGNNPVLFDKKKFVLTPTGWLIVNSWKHSPSFHETQGAFIQLKNKIDELANKIHVFLPRSRDDCPEVAYVFACKLIDIRSIVQSVARHGVQQLSTNYLNLRRASEAESIHTLGEEAFKRLEEATGELFNKLLTYFPQLAEDIKLGEFQLGARHYLNKRDRYCAQLREVKWSSEGGVVIPNKLLLASHKDSERTYNKIALRNAANFMQLPSMVNSLLTQSESVWMPLRPTLEGDEIVFGKGVRGTCERDQGGSVNLYNVYYKRSPNNELIGMSTSAINTPIKAQQFLGAIQEIKAKNHYPETEKNNRWVFHQLNSFFSEKQLLSDVHCQVANIETSFQETDPHASVLHINTAFNAASDFPLEDPESVLKINIESLAQLVGYARADIRWLIEEQDLIKLLSEQESSSGEEGSTFSIGETGSRSTDPFEEGEPKSTNALKEQEQREQSLQCLWKQFEDGCKEVVNRAKTIKKLKRQLREPSVSQDHIPSNFSSREVPANDMTENNRSLVISAPSLVKEVSDGSEGPPRKTLAAVLSRQQSELKNILSTLFNNIEDFLSEFQEEAKRDDIKAPYFSRVSLILEVLSKIFALQLKCDVAPPLSRTSEIELFLLLYRLLGIKVVLTCKSGLDRSGHIVAINDALSRLESELYKSYLNKSNNQDDYAVFLAQQQSARSLFHLIVNIDENRRQLFLLGNAILAEDPSGAVVSDLKWLERDSQGATDVNFREMLLIKIREADRVKGQEEELMCTLHYLELVMAHLLGTQLEKTFFSTGVFGLKYHYRASWLRKAIVMNPHPLERFPQFIFTREGKPVQLLTYSPGGWVFSESVVITSAGGALISRLSHLRGK